VPAPAPAQAPTSSSVSSAARSAEDEAIVRQLELLMLVEMMKDYPMFDDDPVSSDNK
jgi:hypothetical protein